VAWDRQCCRRVVYKLLLLLVSMVKGPALLAFIGGCVVRVETLIVVAVVD